MAGTSTKTKPVSVRIPNGTLAIIDGYAARNNVSRAAAMLHYIQAGIDTDNGESKQATREDMAAIAAKLDALEANRRADVAAIVKAVSEQPIAVQETRALPDYDAWKGKSLLDRVLKR